MPGGGGLGVHGRGSVHGGWRHACQGVGGWACMAGGACMVDGGHACQGGLHVGGTCMPGGIHGRGACVAGGHVWQILRDTVNERAVHILLECILVEQ